MVLLFLNFVFATFLIPTTVLHALAFEPNNSDSYNGTLKLVHVIFRHGDRTNDAGTTYPKDPYLNETYYPFGIGELTNKGKQREYSLGRQLRKRYDRFLGSIYTPDVLEAFSTQMNRTKMSLELVLAGLFPPKGTFLDWENELNWQPIPYSILEFTKDHLMSPALFFCRKYTKLYQSYINSPEGQAIEKKYTELYQYMTINTGLKIKSTFDVLKIYYALIAEEQWGFKLPIWTRSAYPKLMDEAAKDFYVGSTATNQLRQLSGGFLLKRIISDTKLKLDNKLIPQSRKIFLYSGHEINIAYIMGAMGVYFPHVPPYGACIIIEVHTINDVDGIKIFYEDYSGNEPKLLKVAGCDCFCSFGQFIKLLNENVPSSDDMCEQN